MDEQTRTDRPTPLDRLTRRAQFVAVAQRGRKAVSTGLIVQARQRAEDERGAVAGPGIRIGFTASRKVGNAVTRNRARRRLRALASGILPVHACPGYDIVLIARAATPTRPFVDLRADLIRGLRRLGLYSEMGTGPGGGGKRDGAGR